MLAILGGDPSRQKHEYIQGHLKPEEQKAIKVFCNVLNKKPVHLQSHNIFREYRMVELVFEEGGGERMIKLHPVKIQKNHPIDWQKKQYEAGESIVQQLARIIAEQGIPKEIIYTPEDSNDEYFTVTIDFTKVEAHILASARALAPEYAEMSLKEIGENLNARRLQEKSPYLL